MSKLRDIISRSSTSIDSDEWEKICQYICKLPSGIIHEIIYVIILDYYKRKSIEIPQKFVLAEKKRKDVFIITDNFDEELKKEIFSFLKFITEESITELKPES
jgi:hypothetical protein